MKKKALYRGLLGFPLGIFIGYTITIITSLIWAQGYYSPVPHDLESQFGNQISAVILQYVLSGILGAAMATGSVVWEIDNWSILKQSIIHFFIASLSMLPIAYFTHWMDHTFIGIVSYFGIFIAIYVSIWITQYSIWKHKIKQINKTIKKANN